MNVNCVRRFTIQTSVDDLVRVFTRNTFEQNSREAFVFESHDRYGKQIHKFFILESTAQLSLRHALRMQESHPDLVSVEIEKLSTGISFNYPVPVV